MWAIILIVIVVLVAIYWFMTRSNEAEPAKTGMFDAPAPIEFALQAAPYASRTEAAADNSARVMGLGFRARARRWFRTPAARRAPGWRSMRNRTGGGSGRLLQPSIWHALSSDRPRPTPTRSTFSWRRRARPSSSRRASCSAAPGDEDSISPISSSPSPRMGRASQATSSSRRRRRAIRNMISSSCAPTAWISPRRRRTSTRASGARPGAGFSSSSTASTPVSRKRSIVSPRSFTTRG